MYKRGKVMKNNLILGIQGLKKMLKGMFIFAILFMGFSGNAFVRNKAQRTPVKRVPQQTPQNRPARGGTGAPAQQAAAPMTLADKVAWILQQNVPWSDQANAVLKDIWPKISPEQQKAITTYYNKQIELGKILAKKQKEFDRLQKQVEYLKQRINVQPVGAVQATPEKEKGWIQWLTGYDTSKLTAEQGMALGAAGVFGTGIAAITSPVWLPALSAAVAWMGPVGMAKLAGTAYSVNAIKFAYNNGAITMQGAIDSRKNLLQLQLTGGMYPTLALQQEVLVDNGRLELLAIGEDINSDVFTKACVEMLKELKTLDDKLTDDEREFAQSINSAVEACRTKHYKGTYSPKDYLISIKNEAKAQNISEILAYASEYQRTQNQIGLGIAAKLEQERINAAAAAQKAAQELEKATQGEEGTPVEQKPQEKTWSQWLGSYVRGGG